MDLSIPPGKRQYVPLSLEAVAKKKPEPTKEAPATSEKDIMKDCVKLFSAAMQCMANNKLDQARRHLQEIIDKYPGTEYAEKAEELKGKM